MKKGKVFTKSQIVLAAMVLALGAAVWLNMKYSSSVQNGTKYMGQAEYVDNSSGQSLQVSTTPTQDYFTAARDERAKKRQEIKDDITETIKNAGGNSEALKAASEQAVKIAAAESAESNIETLLKAKGFSDVLAVIGDSDVNVVVRGDTLSAEQTIQIQDVASAQSGFSLDKIKILTVK